MNIEILLHKLHRISCWAMMAFMLVFIISGFGMTKQIINPVLATQIHTQILPIPFFVLFVLHISIMIRGILKRKQVFRKQKTVDIYSIIFGIIFLGFLFWLFLI